MDLRIICSRSDGGIDVIIPAPKARQDGETDVDFAARIAAKDGTSKGLVVRGIKHKTQLIGSRYFRDLWEWSETEGKVVVSLAKARAQRMAEIRNMRDLQLVESDAVRSRTEEIGTAADRAATAALRVSLRDIPREAAPALDALTTLDEVMNYEPATWPGPTDSRRAAFVHGQPFGTNVGAEIS